MDSVKEHNQAMLAVFQDAINKEEEISSNDQAKAVRVTFFVFFFELKLTSRADQAFLMSFCKIYDTTQELGTECEKAAYVRLIPLFFSGRHLLISNFWGYYLTVAGR